MESRDGGGDLASPRPDGQVVSTLAAGRGRIRIGLLGCGQWGVKVALTAQRNKYLDLVAVADTDCAKAAELAAHLRRPVAVLTPTDLMGNVDIDAVLIVTHAASHYEVAAATLRAGKHVFVEKPLATSTAECTALIAEADRASRILMVGPGAFHSRVDLVGVLVRAV